jgi:hypothetical protein
MALALLAGPARAGPWGELALRDLQEIHDAIRDNHPGPVDPQNPHFRDWMEQGLVAARAEAREAKDYGDYLRALLRYTNGFRDGHVSLNMAIGPRTYDWPGFIVGDDGSGKVLVLHAEPDAGVRSGDELLACDGQPVADLLAARVEPYFWNRDLTPARLTWAFQLFVVGPDEPERRLTSCRFRSGDVHLAWRSIPTPDFDKIAIASVWAGGDFSLKEVDGVWIVRLPRFWFQDDAERHRLEAVIDQLKANAPAMRAATVVFDVRGNGGGNSAWGERVARALWGDAWPQRVEASGDGSHDIRVSPANEAKFRDIRAQMVRQNVTEVLPYLDKILAAMQAAKTAGRPLARIDSPPTPQTGSAPPNPVTGRVFLLADGGCGSACLNFADLLLQLPGVVLIGRPTNADAVYMDVNEAKLPSELGVLDYGMKVMRHPVRANNQWYEPKHRWPGGEMTDDGIARWVNTLPR